MTDSKKTQDWRVTFLGENIQINQKYGDVEAAAAEEAATEPDLTKLVPIQKALDPENFDHIALFIGADYCPHCKAFAPTVQAAASNLEQKRCKVLFLSNDRTYGKFQASCFKNVGIDVIPYNLDKTRAVRDLFELQTIPALIILKNKDFHKMLPQVVTNARHTLVADPECKFFPWKSDKPMTFMDRFIIRGKYGKWWELGHHISPDFRTLLHWHSILTLP